jgi:hypothetical protein
MTNLHFLLGFASGCLFTATATGILLYRLMAPHMREAMRRKQ